MSFFTRLLGIERRSPSENRSVLDNPSVSLASPGIFQWLSSGEPTASGELINETTALQSITVYSCVRVLAESVASLPLKLYERLPTGRQEAYDALLYDLLAYEPNPEMSAFSFWETMTGCLSLTGNCYAQIQRNGAGQPIALYPLHPLKTEPFRLPTGELAYKTSDGMSSGSTRIIASADILHVPLFGFDGLKGFSPVQLCKQGIGLSRAAEKYGAKFFGNGARPGGILSTSSTLSDTERNNLKESWSNSYGGANQGKTAVLWGDWSYTSIGLSPEESQFLETRRFQLAEICAIFRVPPHMCGDNTRMSNVNHEQMSLGFVTDSLRPYLSRFEQEIKRKLLPDVGRNAGRYFVSFDVRERLRGDFQTTMQGFATGRQWGWYSANNVLEYLGENPIGKVGDVFLMPANCLNAERALDPPAPPSDPNQPSTSGGSPSDGTVQPAQIEAPLPDERNMLDQYIPTFTNLFRDAVGRVSAREKRDVDALSNIFTPVLTSICDVAKDHAASKFNLQAEWCESSDKLVKESLRSLEKRCATWTVENADEVSPVEFLKAVRGIVLNVHREAAAVSVLSELSSEVTS